MFLEYALEILEFKTLDDVTPENLKSAFKRLALVEHPDRGGSQFDAVIEAYRFLSAVLRRRTGGRDHSEILDAGHIRQLREEQHTREMNNLVEEVFQAVDRDKSDAFLKTFNDAFVAFREKEDGNGFHASEARGYGDWLAADTVNASAVDRPSLDAFHATFETHARAGKEPVTTLALHPDQMAVRVSCGGMALARASDTFTSDWLDRPEYTDLQDAYTRSTVIDQLPAFQDVERSFEAILKERDMVYETELDRDLAAIQAYEARCQAEEAEHKRRVAEYFRSTGSSQWALRDGAEAVAGAEAGGAGVDDGDEKEENTRSR
jgi:curved DNA-binding protein CbpA